MSVDSKLVYFHFLSLPLIQEVGNKSLFQDTTVLQVVQAIRSNHSLLKQYMHSSRLVRAINSFALTDCELPDGWEKKMDKTGKVCTQILLTTLSCDHKALRTCYNAKIALQHDGCIDISMLT